jgi:hypothetical protein
LTSHEPVTTRRFSRTENWTIILKVSDCGHYATHTPEHGCGNGWTEEGRKLTGRLAEVYDSVVVLEHVELVDVGEGLDT